MNKFKFYYSQIKALKYQYDETEDETKREGIRTSYRNITDQINREGQAFIQLMRYHENSQECGNDCLNIDGTVWDSDIPALIQTMRENGIEEFTYSSQSTSAIENAWIFTQNGCSFEGMREVNINTKSFMSNEWDKGHALLFKVN